MKIKRLAKHEIVTQGDLVYVDDNGDNGLRELQGTIGVRAGEYAYPIFRADIAPEIEKLQTELSDAKKEIAELKADDWVSVSERLPDEGQKIDIWVDGVRVADCKFSSERFLKKINTLGEHYWVTVISATHWKPITKPTEQVE